MASEIEIKQLLAGEIGGAGGFCTWKQAEDIITQAGIEIGKRDTTVAYQNNPNVIYWTTSAQVAAAISSGIAEGLFRLEACNVLLYGLDGVGLDLRIASAMTLTTILVQMQEGGEIPVVREPMWLPTLITTRNLWNIIQEGISPGELRAAIESTAENYLQLVQLNKLVSERLSNKNL